MNTIIENKRINNPDKIISLQQEIAQLKNESKVLKEQLKLQNLALNVSQNSTVITDNRGSIIWVNKAFTDLTGYTFEEAINKNPRILKSGIHSTEFYKNLWDTINSGNAWSGEITNKKKNGSIYHEKLLISPVQDTNNNITNFVATKQDITLKKHTDDTLNDLYIKYEELAYIFN